LVLLKGNHEAGVLGELPLSWFGRHALLALNWTRSMLPQEALDFLATSKIQQALTPLALAPQLTALSPHQPPASPFLAEGTNDILFLHGSLGDPYDYLDSTWKADELFQQMDAPLCFLGHTHFAGWFELAQKTVLECSWPPKRGPKKRFGEISGVESGNSACRWQECPQGGTLRLEKGKRYVINCGSVGQPRDGNPEAAFGIFDPALGKVELRRIGYDINGAQERIRQAGLPPVLAERLAYGN
jgi:diadenosine tetraphosphatase ApaH/serine/threonine PP2A family protein phosphatase